MNSTSFLSRICFELLTENGLIKKIKVRRETNKKLRSLTNSKETHYVIFLKKESIELIFFRIMGDNKGICIKLITTIPILLLIIINIEHLL